MKNKIQMAIFSIVFVFCVANTGCSKRASSVSALSVEQIESLVNFGIFTGKEDFGKFNLTDHDKLVLDLIVKYNDDGLTEEVNKQLKDAIQEMDNLELKRKLLILSSAM
jgi:hypothetical protein